MNKEELYDLIDRHLRNELTPEEEAHMEKLLKDTSFTRELNLHKEIRFVLTDKGLLEFKEKIKEADQNYFTENPAKTTHKGISFYLKIAATVILLVGVIATILLLVKPTDNAALYEAHFTPYKAPVNFRSTDSPYADEDWKQALAKYDEGKYKEAIPYFNDVVKNKPDNKLALLLRGVSFMSSGSFASAEQDFNSILHHRENMFVQQAKWYLSLALLRQNKIDEAKSILTNIDTGVYHKKAQALLGEIQ